jgi:hypothetical protein
MERKRKVYLDGMASRDTLKIFSQHIVIHQPINKKVRANPQYSHDG